MNDGGEIRPRNGVVFEERCVGARSSYILLLARRIGSFALDSPASRAFGMGGLVGRIGRRTFDGTRSPFRLGNGRHRRW